ncbi:2-amino-4-hydroxy-6-hydroxymethyldihydropteridine diphosphokinase [Cellulosimicrobium sp. NPDC057127]|uniref:2-amino-4-hydroxy-6- hydroxymethyldihydropteridine diphosphokinase n=1 Tax=Cellulosimicrobium sp. NPDC057127 TaxID=3346026 RepID=UPI00362D26C5
MTTAFAGAVLDADGRPFDRIRLTGLSSTGHHGVLDHERADGQVFRADVVLHLDTREAARGDELADTVSYAGVAEDVVAVLAGSPADLIETVAERIAATILTHPDVVAVDVAVHKPQAPLTVPFDDVEVVIRRDRVVVPVVPPLARRHDGGAQDSRPVAPIPVGSVAPALIHGVEAPREPEPASPASSAGPDVRDEELPLAPAPSVMPPSIPPSSAATGALEVPVVRAQHDAVDPLADAHPGPQQHTATGPTTGPVPTGPVAAAMPVAAVPVVDMPVGGVPLASGPTGPVDVEGGGAVPPSGPDGPFEPSAGGEPGTDDRAGADGLGGGRTDEPAAAADGAETAAGRGGPAPTDPAPAGPSPTDPAPAGPSPTDPAHAEPPRADPASAEPERPRDRMDEVPADFVEVVLALGANLGDAQQTLRRAITDLDRIPGLEITDVSPLARTAAVGPEQPDYLNTVLLARTRLSARDLLHACHDVEHAHGRVRDERWGPRTLDVDLVVYGSLTDVADDLELPHPRAHERAFVLEPWSQVDPDAVLPGLGGGPVAALAATAPDRAGIRWLALDWLTEPAPNPTGAVPVAAADAPAPQQPAPQQPAPQQSTPEQSAAQQSVPQQPPTHPPGPQQSVPPVPQPADRPAPPADVRPPFAPVSEGPRSGAFAAPEPPLPTQQPVPTHPPLPPQQAPADLGAAAPVFSPVRPAELEPGDARDVPGTPPSGSPRPGPGDEGDGIIRGVPFAAVAAPQPVTAPQPVAAPGPLADPALHPVVPPVPVPTVPAPHAAPAPSPQDAPPTADDREPDRTREDERAPRQDLWPPFPPVSGPAPDAQR